MPFLPQLLLTTALSALLGAAVGHWSRPQVSETKPPPAPSRAATAIATVDSLPTKPPLFTSVTASIEWAKRQMEAGRFEAAELLFRQEAGLSEAQRLELAEALVSQYRRMEPWMLGRILLSLPPGEATTHQLSRLVMDWCWDDADDALRFLETMPPDRLNTMLLHNAGFSLSRLPPERVLAFAAKLNDKGRAFLAEGMANSADQAGSWGNTSAILSRLNVKPEKEAMSVEWHVAVDLADRAPQDVSHLIAAETHPAKRAQLFGGYAWVVGSRDPAQGVLLDAQIENLEMREGHLRRHLNEWLGTDRAAALTWLQSAEAAQIMRPEQRAQFLKSNGLEVQP